MKVSSELILKALPSGLKMPNRGQPEPGDGCRTVRVFFFSFLTAPSITLLVHTHICSHSHNSVFTLLSQVPPVVPTDRRRAKGSVVAPAGGAVLGLVR